MLTIGLPCSINKFSLNVCRECKPISDELYSLFYPYATYDEYVQSSMYDVVFDVEKDNISVVIGNDVIYSHSYSVLFDAYRKIVSIIRDNTILKENYCLLHGATIAYDTSAYLLLAESQMGKSTLSMFMHMTNEFECIGDDVVIIDMRNFQIYPISKYIHIRENAIDLIGTNMLATLTYNSLIDRYQYRLYDHRFNKEFIVKGIFILDRKESANRVNRVGSPYTEIIHNSFLPFQLRNNVVNSVLLSNRIDVWRSEYSTLVQAYQHIKQICNEHIK